ncbi:MAG: DUF2141 domain-containing protein [Novosphingobium sp.]
MKAGLRQLARWALCGAAIALFTAKAQAQPAAPADCVGTPSAVWLRVTVDDVRSASGLIALTLYADERSRFLVKGGSLAVMRVPAQQGTTQACIFLPAAGIYAVAVYHDEDANQKFNRSGLGFPAEGFGFSNNPATLAGLPSFGSVRLRVTQADLHTRIRLKYP